MTLPGGPTKDEILAISLAKLRLRPTDILADIGCGTGTVAIRASPLVNRVLAIDLRGEAVAYAKKRAEEACAGNIEFICGDAASVLPEAGRIDAAFVGGSRGLPAVLSLLASRKVRSIVVNAVRLETVSTGVAAMQELGIFREAVQVQVCRTEPLGRGLIWKPLHPVTIIVGGEAGCS
jgi:cobalt-precorrin-6B (C15)-methyltransferase